MIVLIITETIRNSVSLDEMDIKKECSKKKVFFNSIYFFVVLTFVGAGYVLYNKGTVNAGYAVIPMLFGLIFGMLYRNNKKAIEENKD